jgi:hypothetical protein
MISLVKTRFTWSIRLGWMKRLKDPTQPFFGGDVVSIQFYRRFKKLAGAFDITGSFRQLASQIKTIG